jgi:hypothetical protein
MIDMAYNKIKVYSTWKTGSTFLRNFFATAAQLKNLNIVRLHKAQGQFVPLPSFQKAKPKEIELSTVLPNNNYCALVYRFFPTEKTLNNTDIIHLIQIRDPRDVLVSLYFSLGYIHDYGKNTKNVRDKIQKIDINTFVLKNSFYFEEIYKDLFISTKYKNVQYLSYKDMVINFKTWANNNVKYFNLNEQQKESLYLQHYSQFENIKETSKEELLKGPTKHNRKMLPGDYKEKLNDETIDILNKKFKSILELIDNLFKV